jgi:putative heme-binding domain-containing protein
MKHLPFGFLLLSLLAGRLIPSEAQAQDKKTQSQRSRIYSPEEELAGFRLADGFVIELVASERDGVINPVDLTFDDAGRLWTQTARMYPLDPVADIKWNDLLKLMDDPEAQKKHPAFQRILDLYQGKTKGEDQILILSDLYRGRPAKSTVWADGLTIPMSVLPYKDGAYVAQGSELFFLNDTDHDGKADQRTPLLTGFGFTDTHTMSHVLVRGPGDWVHFSQGALNKGVVSSLTSKATLKLDYSKIARFSLDATKIELVSAGLNNIWGFQLRGNGQWFGSEANDLGYSVAPLEPGSAFPGIGNERLRPYQPFVPVLHEFRVGGTGISGTAFADDASGSFPAEFRDVAFLANPITSSINAVRIVRNGDGSVTAQHLPDLLTSEDDWFRPVNMEFGPDGCLYIADWYNKIVSHNELPTTHPDRDKSSGRIWRIRHVSQQPREIPDFYQVKTNDLVPYLQSPSLWAKRAAWHQIADRPAAETAVLKQELLALASDTQQDEISRIHALWSLEAIKQFDATLMASLVKSPLANLRREAVRSLAGFGVSPSQMVSYTRTLLDDQDPTVRAQVLRTFAEAGVVDENVIELLVRACKPELPGNAMGGPYERKFERYLARRALERYPDALQKYLNNGPPQNIPVTNLLWAIESLPKEKKEAAFMKLWPQARLTQVDEPTFVGIAQMLGNPEINTAVKPLLQNLAQAKNYVTFALQNQAQIQSPELAEVLVLPVRELLKSKDVTEAELALDALSRYRIEVPENEITPFITNVSTDKTLKLALKALESQRGTNQNVFNQIVQDTRLTFDIRAAALNSLVKADSIAGGLALSAWVPLLDRAQRTELAVQLSGSQSGAGILLDQYREKQLDLSTFDLPVAERIANSRRDDRQATILLENVRKRETENKKEFNVRLARYMAIAQKNTGDPKAGKVLFQTCLLCHQVGTSGQAIAPALDGSANREHEALLTAILDPDAAVESGYAVFRVMKKDGTSLEGYLVSRDERGTTLAFMGGGKQFIDIASIRSQGFLSGRSFMVKGLIDQYSDKQVSDLLSYIRTLK